MPLSRVYELCIVFPLARDPDSLMKHTIIELAYQGDWDRLLELLQQHKSLVNCASEFKGYTPLHQAAWHGAKPTVIGKLLALGANPTLRTLNKLQTARDIALEKHRARQDLAFLLSDLGRTPSQLIRKLVAENQDFFVPYDGNRIVCDRLIEALAADLYCLTKPDFEARLAGAFKAVTGSDWEGRGDDIPVSAGPGFEMHATSAFWVGRFASLFRDCAMSAALIPLEKHWATMSDLFYPYPDGWGLRGDLFLWMEMKSALNHVSIPERELDLGSTVSSLFHVLTGAALTSEAEIHVPRFDVGGMSGGMVSAAYWRESLVPQLQRRAAWLQETWGQA